jgi:hypothetical protein
MEELDSEEKASICFVERCACIICQRPYVVTAVFYTVHILLVNH